MMNRSQTQQEEERAVFTSFLEREPRFAGEPIRWWHLAESDPPDIICSTISGRTVGVELCEWLNEEEMRAGKLRERIGQQLLDAIGHPQPMNVSGYFDMVIIHPQQQGRLGAESDREAFRKALFRLIYDVDCRWPNERSWHTPRGCHIRDFTAWFPLGKYLDDVHFHPGQQRWPEGIDWILPPANVDTFDDRTMSVPLSHLICRKLTKYKRHSMEALADELVLLVFFNQGAMYNSPIETPHRKLAHLINDVCQQFDGAYGPFSKAYVFMAPSPGERVFRLW